MDDTADVVLADLYQRGDVVDLCPGPTSAPRPPPRSALEDSLLADEQRVDQSPGQDRVTSH
ncbi:hypothetical protein T261_0299 [Streptomyces lydicus]|nr:hypothetical protein T261_0299 [Streptomyces lydicus]